jgi:Fe-S oxidoreductase
VAAGKHPYYVEAYPETERPRRFLEAFAAILEHTNYDFVLDNFARTVTRCGRCATSCQVYQASGEARDIPCERSDLLLSVYKRYFTTDGRLTGRFGGGFELTDEHIDRMADEYYRCTACKRCKADCPMAVDHGLVTHLGRWILVRDRDRAEGAGRRHARAARGQRPATPRPSPSAR